MITDQEEYGLTIACWGLRVCFERVDDEIKNWGGAEKIENECFETRERNNTRYSNVQDLIGRDTNLSQLAWEAFYTGDYFEYSKN